MKKKSTTVERVKVLTVVIFEQNEHFYTIYFLEGHKYPLAIVFFLFIP